MILHVYDSCVRVRVVLVFRYTNRVYMHEYFTWTCTNSVYVCVLSTCTYSCRSNERVRVACTCTSSVYVYEYCTRVRLLCTCTCASSVYMHEKRVHSRIVHVYMSESCVSVRVFFVFEYVY